MSTTVEVEGDAGGAGHHTEGGQVEASVSERLEAHGADLARIEAELRAEIDNVRAEIGNVLAATPNVDVAPISAELTALGERLGSLEAKLEQVEEEATSEPEPEPPPEPDRPPKRPHFLHRRLFGRGSSDE